MFDSLEPDSHDEVRVPSMLERLLETGLRPDDSRLQEVFRTLENADARAIDFDSFSTVIGPCRGLIERALAGRLTIPDFSAFTAEVAALFEHSLERRDGTLANYIPQLARVDPEHFAVAICTADGQMFSIGDANLDFSVQSCAKPLIYSLALEEHGAELVHRYIGREPSGRGFNELSLDPDGKPHNPMINSGAIMACALLQRGQDIADRFEFVLDSFRRLAGGRKVGFSNAVYLSERRSADRNFALGYLMREHKAFPDNTQLIETLEFYLQCCSVEANAEVMAVIAATLANAGVCPTTGLRQLEPATVQNCLSLMSSCGMYDFSGEFAFTVGLPAKSGVSGAIIGVVPNVLGFCCWSPRLDEHGNSVRGLDFCRRLVEAYNFHAFDNLTGMSEKKDPRLTRAQGFADDAGQVTWAASFGDLKGIRQLVARGVDPERGNFDGRTALHLAAAEGQIEVVEYLLSLGVEPRPVDRFGNTPLDDARREGHDEVIKALASRDSRQD
ncbi:Glutaminase 2 [Enhygromyxa salina]|uniref:Glutaminase n=1 Tax=Enhygromyxa salina TaxID=215803 RepID=A0A2S9Y690_9BACT|nr:Glutaminase 2 [Enhygromyxa salina]